MSSERKQIDHENIIHAVVNTYTFHHCSQLTSSICFRKRLLNQIDPCIPTPPAARQYSYLSTNLRQVTQFLVLNTFQVFFLDQLINGFLDVGNLGCEPGFDLRNGLGHELNMLHLLSRFHDSHNSRLSTSVSSLLSFCSDQHCDIRILTCMSNLRSSSIVLCVSSTSCFCSDLTAIFRLTFIFLCLKL